MNFRSLSVVAVFIGAVCLAAAAQFSYSRQTGQVGPPISSVPGRPQKPMKDAHFYGSEQFSLTDVRDLWNGADLVIDAVVMELIAADEPVPGEPPQTLIVTTYKLLALEALKVDGSWKAGDGTVLVTRLGGIRDREDHILRKSDPRFPLFDKDQRYIVFLNALRRNEYAPAFGPDGVFEVTSGRIKPWGKSALSTRLGALSFSALRNVLLNQRGK